MLFPSVNRQKAWMVGLLMVVVCLNLYFHFTFEGNLKDRSRWLDSLFSRVLYPIKKVADLAESATVSGTTYISRLTQAETENEKLRSQLKESELKLQSLSEIQNENDRLHALIDFKKSQTAQLVAAKVIGRDPSLYFRTLEVDRGTSDGVAESMAVVSPSGVVGRVFRANPYSSSILLITDVNSRIDGVVARSRTRVIIGGSPDGNPVLRYLPRRFDVRQGDEIVTSGLGGLFPAGFKVGTIIGLAQDPNLVLEQAEVEAAVDFDSIEEVFIVKTQKGNPSL